MNVATKIFQKSICRKFENIPR